MKKFSKLFISLLAAGSLASCSSDNFDGPATPQPGEADGVHMKLTISLPVSGGTRAAGDSGEPVGDEVGQTWENTVKEVLIVLADKTNNSFISSSVVTSPTAVSGQTGQYTAEATFNASVLVNYIEAQGSTEDQVQVKVYAFCNPTPELKNVIASRSRGDDKSLWIDEKYVLGTDNLDLNSVKKGTIPMANSKVRDTSELFSLPKKDDILKGVYAETAYDMTKDKGALEVMRSIARFDYKTINEGKYLIDIKEIGTDGISKAIKDGLEIQLTHMALINMSKSFYYLHRTGSATGTNLSYGGKDNKPTSTSPNSYIVDCDWTWKNQGNWSNEKKYSDNYWYPLFTDALFNEDGTVTEKGKLNIESWNRIKLSDINSNEEDGNGSWNEGDKNTTDNEGYRIWRYVTENTIPGAAVNQKNAISTGIAFRGVMKATSETPENLAKILDENASNHEPIFVYKDGTIYENWNAVAIEAQKPSQAQTAFAAAYNACNGKTGEALYTEAVKNQFTIYRYDPAEKGYTCVYYYWNRHWDNGNPGVMDPMEFAVVRNNVYKLSVLDISGLGHPRNPGDDPDPKNPDDPDESADVKIKLDVKIKNWTVRKNGIHL